MEQTASRVKLFRVKVMRVFVLLLVCLLLPLRGTLAATLPCAQQGSAGTLNAATDQVYHGMPCNAAGADGPMHDHRHGASHDSAHRLSPDDEDGANSQGDSCHVCCASACAAALTAAAAGTPDALPVLSTVFPALHVPAPDFQSDGQERPPRTV